MDEAEDTAVGRADVGDARLLEELAEVEVHRFDGEVHQGGQGDAGGVALGEDELLLGGDVAFHFLFHGCHISRFLLRRVDEAAFPRAARQIVRRPDKVAAPFGQEA